MTLTLPGLRPPALARPLAAPRRRWRPSISAVLTVGLVLGVLIAMGGALVVGLGTAQRNTRDLLRWQAQAMVQSLQIQVRQHLAAAASLDRSVVLRIAAGELDPSDLDAVYTVLRYGRAAAPQVVGAAFITADYQAVGSGEIKGEESKMTMDWSARQDVRALLQDARTRGREPWFNTAWLNELDTGGVAANQAVYDGDRFIGLVVAVVSMRALSEFTADLAESNVLTAFILYGPDDVLAHPALANGPYHLTAAKPFPSLRDVNDPVLMALWDGQGQDVSAELGQDIIGRLIDTPGGEQVLLARPLDGYGNRPLYVGGHFSLAETGGVLDRLEHAIFAAGSVLVVTLIGVFLLGRSIARPIRALAEAARSVESLELDKVPRLAPSPFRETAAAAEAFNAMLLGLQRFSTYVPRSLMQRLVRRGATRSEEREVTILFTDIVGFTPLAGSLGPTALAELLNEHFALVATEIDREEGTVDKYIGDCVMAFWGAPDAQPDHAARALRSALGIVRALAADNRRRRARGLPPIRMRLGLNSGPVVVGNVGAPGRINYTLIGDAVNTAQRLETLGRDYLGPDDEAVILASAETVAALPPGLAEVEPLGPIVLLGQTRPTEVVRLRPLMDDASDEPGEGAAQARPIG